MSNPLPPAILLMGPTASGKTAAAMRLSEHFPVELISVDSAQVFRDMNVGTAKPDVATLARYPHHLINLISPEEAYSAARFREDALAVMSDIARRGRVPLLVGGTMLYFRSLMQGLADLPQADPAVRAEIDAFAAERGWPAVHAELARVDPETAARLSPTDSQRLQRALEVFRLSGQPMSQHLRESQPSTNAAWRFLPLALLPSERSVLHSRIATRFEAMLAEGLEDEVQNLREKYDLHPDLPSMRCVGYRQVWEAQDGLMPYRELRDRGIFATRQLAKRQITWLTNSFDCQRFDCLSSDLDQQLASAVSAFLAP